MRKIFCALTILTAACTASEERRPVDEEGLCWQNICAGQTLSETTTRLRDDGFAVHKRPIGRFIERITPSIGGVWTFEGHLERVWAKKGETRVDMQLVRFPSGRLRLESLTAVTMPEELSGETLSQAVARVSDRLGPPDRINWETSFPLKLNGKETAAWAGFWEYPDGGAGDWVSIDFLVPARVVMSDSSVVAPPDAENLMIVGTRYQFNALNLVGLAANRAWEAKKPGWTADQVTGCKVWNNFPRDNDQVRWSGQCQAGLAEGQGTLEWSEYGRVYETIEGTFKEGKIDGRAVTKIVGGRTTFQGTFRANRPNGSGVLTRGGKKYSGEWNDGCLEIGGHSVAFYTNHDSCSPY